MAITWRQNRWVRFFLWGVVVVIILALLLGLALLLLGYLNIIDLDALKETWLQRLGSGSGEEEAPEEPDELVLLERELAELKRENTTLRGKWPRKAGKC